MDGWWEGLSGYDRLVSDDEGLYINGGDQNSSEEKSGSELHRSRAEHIGDNFGHCEYLCEVARCWCVVGESNGRNERAQMQEEALRMPKILSQDDTLWTAFSRLEERRSWLGEDGWSSVRF